MPGTIVGRPLAPPRQSFFLFGPRATHGGFGSGNRRRCGSTSKEEAKPAADNAYDMQTNIARRRIETGASEAADSLLSARNTIAELDRNAPDYNTWLQADINNYWANRRIYQSKEADARSKISASRTDFTILTENVRRHYGGRLPPTWRETMNCAGCP